MKLIPLGKYQKPKKYIIEGLIMLSDYYAYLDFVLVLGTKGTYHPIYSRSTNDLYGGTVFIDPESAFKANYVNKDLNTIARIHMANVKAAKIPLEQARLMDFVLGVAHEVGHIRMGHGRLLNRHLYNTNDKYRQLCELEAEREVYIFCSQYKYKDQAWIDIIEPEPIDTVYDYKDIIFAGNAINN